MGGNIVFERTTTKWLYAPGLCIARGSKAAKTFRAHAIHAPAAGAPNQATEPKEKMQPRKKHLSFPLGTDVQQTKTATFVHISHIVPPRSCALTVTRAAPHHTTTNTAAKTNAFCSFGAVKLRMIDSVRHTISGPHKSPGETRNALVVVVGRGGW